MYKILEDRGKRKRPIMLNHFSSPDPKSQRELLWRSMSNVRQTTLPVRLSVRNTSCPLHISYTVFYHPTTKCGGYNGFDLSRPSVGRSVRPSPLSCPLYKSYTNWRTFNVVKSYHRNKIGRTDGQTDGHDGGRRVNILSPSVTTDSELTVLN